jgi:hypothetical protein
MRLNQNINLHAGLAVMLLAHAVFFWYPVYELSNTPPSDHPDGMGIAFFGVFIAFCTMLIAPIVMIRIWQASRSFAMPKRRTNRALGMLLLAAVFSPLSVLIRNYIKLGR